MFFFEINHLDLLKQDKNKKCKQAIARSLILEVLICCLFRLEKKKKNSEESNVKLTYKKTHHLKFMFYYIYRKMENMTHHIFTLIDFLQNFIHFHAEISVKCGLYSFVSVSRYLETVFKKKTTTTTKNLLILFQKCSHIQIKQYFISSSYVWKFYKLILRCLYYFKAKFLWISLIYEIPRYIEKQIFPPLPL